jgi:hypothetical protein
VQFRADPGEGAVRSEAADCQGSLLAVVLPLVGAAVTISCAIAVSGI